MIQQINEKIEQLKQEKARLEAEAPIILRERMLSLEQTLRAEISVKMESYDQRINDLEALLEYDSADD
jgi:uncharacterized membrane protein YgaE (UPF0421/DUF939 family)